MAASLGRSTLDSVGVVAIVLAGLEPSRLATREAGLELCGSWSATSFSKGMLASAGSGGGEAGRLCGPRPAMRVAKGTLAFAGSGSGSLIVNYSAEEWRSIFIMAYQ